MGAADHGEYARYYSSAKADTASLAVRLSSPLARLSPPKVPVQRCRASSQNRQRELIAIVQGFVHSPLKLPHLKHIIGHGNHG